MADTGWVTPALTPAEVHVTPDIVSVRVEPGLPGFGEGRLFQIPRADWERLVAGHACDGVTMPLGAQPVDGSV